MYIINDRKLVLPSPLDSILLAVLTVSPNRQYRGILRPTTPAHTGPETKIYRIKQYKYNTLLHNAREKAVGLCVIWPNRGYITIHFKMATMQSDPFYDATIYMTFE